MPYKIKGKCVYRKDTGKKMGCTKGSVKRYMRAIQANTHENFLNHMYNDILLENENEKNKICLLKISPPNAKIDHPSFSLPSGFTCPFATSCLSKADRYTGKIKDGKFTDFRCFAASQESVFPAVRNQRWTNFDALKEVGITNIEAMSELIVNSIINNLTTKTKYFRIHVGGDFFNEYYFKAWVNVAKRIPQITFYAYTKSVPYVVDNLPLPANFVITVSKGGDMDHMIDKYNLKYAQVVFSEDEAKQLGLEIDHDDSHAYENNKPFALLLHGIQPAGSVASQALKKLGGIGGSSSYSFKKKEERNKIVPLNV